MTEFADGGSLYHFLEGDTRLAKGASIPGSPPACAEVDFMEYEQLIAWTSDIALGVRYLHHEAPGRPPVCLLCAQPRVPLTPWPYALAPAAPVRIIHRDLKSLNILVVTAPASGELVLKICDFGSSRQVCSPPWPRGLSPA